MRVSSRENVAREERMQRARREMEEKNCVKELIKGLREIGKEIVKEIKREGDELRQEMREIRAQLDRIEKRQAEEIRGKEAEKQGEMEKKTVEENNGGTRIAEEQKDERGESSERGWDEEWKNRDWWEEVASEDEGRNKKERGSHDEEKGNEIERGDKRAERVKAWVEREAERRIATEEGNKGRRTKNKMRRGEGWIVERQEESWERKEERERRREGGDRERDTEERTGERRGEERVEGRKRYSERENEMKMAFREESTERSSTNEEKGRESRKEEQMERGSKGEKRNAWELVRRRAEVMRIERERSERERVHREEREERERAKKRKRTLVWSGVEGAGPLERREFIEVIAEIALDRRAGVKGMVEIRGEGRKEVLLVEMEEEEDKEELFDKRWELKKRWGVTVDEELTREERKMRWRIEDKAKKERRELGNSVVATSRRIWVSGKELK